LASGLYGIRHGLELKQAPVSGNGYRDTANGVLPRDLKEATETMKNSALTRELFGETFPLHFIETREWEWRQHLKAVTDWELKRYFEII
ncbi:MAG: glutamine synthetase, partial [Chitinophagaceae bacterium]